MQGWCVLLLILAFANGSKQTHDEKHPNRLLQDSQTAKSKSKYSSFECIGGSQVLKTDSMQQTSVKVWPLNNPEFRTCHYRNVCLVNGSITYFQKYSKDGQVPKEYLPEGFDGNVNHLSYLRAFTMPVVTHYGPIDMSKSTFHPIKYTFLDSNSWSFNYGHYLNDNVMPTFVASKLFDFPIEESQQLFETSCRLFSTLEEAFSNRVVAYNRSLGTYRQACMNRLETMWPHFYNHPPLFIDKLSQDKGLCLQHLVTGQGSSFGLKSLDLSRGLYFRAFRDYVLNRVMKSKPSMPQQEHLILVGLRTVGSAGGSIIQDLCQKTKLALQQVDDPEHRQRFKIECFVPSDLSFEDEIAMVRRAKVLISVHGTITYMVLFARDGTQQISVASPKELKENQMLLYATHFHTMYLTWDKMGQLPGVLEHALTLSDAFSSDNNDVSKN